MSTSSPPKKNAALTFYVHLPSQANPNVFQLNPTLATGDVKVSIDGGSLANLTTLPVVTPAGAKGVKVDLTASEMNGDQIRLMFSDVAGNEWCDVGVSIQTSTRQVDDLMPTYTQPTGFLAATFPSTVSSYAGGAVASVTGSVGSVTGSVGGSVVGSVASVIGNVGGSVVGSVASVTGNVGGNVSGNVTGSVGSVVGSVGGNVTGSVASVIAGVTVSDKTGFSLSGAGVTAVAAGVWDYLTSAAVTVGSFGKKLSDWVVGTLTSGERTSIANEVESQIIDETDSEKVLTAITDKIASVNPSLGSLTLAAITSSVWASASRTLTAGTNIVLAKDVGVTGFNDVSTSQVWANGTRTLTAGTNIVLAKGVGVTGFNDLSAAQVNTEADTALSDAGYTSVRAGYLDYINNVNLASVPSFPANFGTLLIDSSGHVGRVTLVDTTTTNTDMRGTNNAVLAASAPIWYIDPVDSTADIASLAVAVAAVQTRVDQVPTLSQIWTTTQTESYAAAGAVFSPIQALYEISANIAEIAIVGATGTFYKRDHTTSAGTFTLDDSYNPTTRHRAT